MGREPCTRPGCSEPCPIWHSTGIHVFTSISLLMILFVGKDKDFTGRSHRYVCITERSLNVDSEEGIEMIASFDIEEKNC